MRRSTDTKWIKNKSANGNILPLTYVGTCLKNYDCYFKKRLDLNIKDLSNALHSWI